MTIRVQGSDAIRRKLNRVGEVGKGQMLVRALTAAALPVQNEAKRNAPYESGNLRRSIHIGGRDDLNPDAGTVIDRTGTPVPDPDVDATAAAVYVGTDVVYAAAQEFGTQHIAAQPYLRPAADTQRPAVVSEVAAAMRDMLRAAL
jgi:HK97 gp10 family phage protein